MKKGKILFHYLLPKQALTHFAGFVAGIRIPAIKNRIIRRFIQKYDVNMAEALYENPEQYANFNDFFIRLLKPECRPIADAGIISPVDGSISEIGQITAGKLLQAKGRDYSLQELLAVDDDLSAPFNSGCFTTLYLSPKDYHRIHMPIDGVLKQAIYIPGSLFSVQPLTVESIPNLFARNERVVAFFDTPVGLMAMVLIGATIVGSIHTHWHGCINRNRNHTTTLQLIQGKESDLVRKKAEEMGYFKLGSTVIVLFADKERVQWMPHLKAGDRVQFGNVLSPLG